MAAELIDLPSDSVAADNVLVAPIAPPNIRAPRTLLLVALLMGLLLLAKLTIDIADATLTYFQTNDARFLFSLLLTTPLLIVLTYIVDLRRRNAVGVPMIKRVVLLSMIVITLQLVLRPILLKILDNSGSLFQAYSHVLTDTVFMVVPTFAMARIHGRRSGFLWALIGVSLNTIALALLDWDALSQIDLRLFLAVDTVLLIMAFYGGAVANVVRDEKAQLVAANRLLEEQSKMREQLAASHERMRMARDLHDTVAHSLAGLVFQLDALGILLGEVPARTQQLLTRSKMIAKQGLEETRVAITDLREDLIEDTGLVNALQQHIESVSLLSSIPITFEYKDTQKTASHPDALNNMQADALFRIAQEAIYNALRHSRARRIRVQVEQERHPELFENRVVLRVTDDGIGFETAERDGHYGLRGMRERAELVGAQIQVNSRIGNGTTLLVTLTVTL